MKTKNFLYFVLLLLIGSCSVYSQKHPRFQNLLNEFGIGTYSYLLTANRPVYSVETDMVDKSKLELNTGFDAGSGTFDAPVSINYGAGKNTELFAGIDLFSQSYDFTQKKISGVGDANVGLKYRFQHSNKFSHVFQVLVKLPTASKDSELGTGKTDFHFGLAQAYTSNVFCYDLSLELNMLHRRDFPDARKYPPAIQQKIDSLKSHYDYQYEPEVVLSIGPSFNISKNVLLYSGFSFDRNTKLDYNSELVYGGFAWSISDRFAISIGGSYGLQQSGTWNVSTGMNILLN